MTTPPPAPLTPPTLSEERAEGRLADLFADLRSVMGVPVAPLVFRRIALLPGCLEWSWARLRPLYSSPALEALGAELSSGIELPPMDRLASTDLAAVGVDAAGVETVRATLSVFRRSNPLHLIALTALHTALSLATEDTEDTKDARGRDVHEAPEPSEEWGRQGQDPVPSPRLERIPPMLAEEELDAPAAALARQLAALGGKDAPRAIPSIWGILAHWPGYLELALNRLKPLEENGWLAASSARLTARMVPAAEKATLLLGAPPDSPPQPAPPLEELREVLRQFTSSVIVRIIPLLAVLGESLPEPLREGEPGAQSDRDESPGS